MATRTWQGGGAPNADDWGQANNWIPNVVPVNGDEVYFDRGSQDVAQGLAQGAVDLDLLYISNKYSGSIGGSGIGSLQLNWIYDFYYEGQGDECYLDTAHATGITKAVVADTGSGANALHLGSVITALAILKGNVTLDTGADAQDIRVGRVSGSTDVDLTISASVTLSVVVQWSGVVVSRSSLATLWLTGGSFTHGAAGDAITMTTGSIFPGGTLNYITSGNLTTLSGYGGTFDASDSRGPFTIATLNYWYGSTVNLANGLLNIAITNHNYYGGDLILDPGRVL